MMRAIVQEGYGPPENLEVREVERPAIGADGVLVRVIASSVNAMDWHHVRGEPLVARAVFGLRRPKHAIPGRDVAGVVEEVGNKVTGLRPGDAVFGARAGAFAEFVAGHVDDFAPKPPDLSFRQAAAIPVAAITALQALRDKGAVKSGQSVLILGAGGGVGSFAVQLAKAFGARVTATTSTDKVETVRAIGADTVIDYTREDAGRSHERFDLVLDIGGSARLGDLDRLLVSGGTAVGVGGTDATVHGILAGLVEAQLRSRLGGKRFPILVAKVVHDDLLVLARFAAAGQIVPVIDRVYPLDRVPEAIRYVGSRQARGKVVVTVDVSQD